MQYLVSRKTKLRACAIMVALFVSTIVIARFGVSASSSPDGSTTGALGTQSLEAITVHAAKRGNPRMNLQDGRSMTANYKDATLGAASLNGARPLSLASGDVNGDGFPDLIAGYTSANGSFVTLSIGNPEAFGPTKSETIDAIKNGQFRDSFQPDAAVLSVPEAPEFLALGDFDRDGRLDILMATRGSDTLYLAAGEAESRGFSAPQSVHLPGVVTALATITSEGLAKVAVGIASSAGPQVSVYATKQSVLTDTPVTYSLPAAATAIAIGQLDDNAPADLAVAAGNQVLIIHDAGQPAPEEKSAAAFYQSQIERVNFSSPVRSVAVGDFIADRQSRMELAALGDDGTIHVLTRGQLDTRPLIESEVLVLRQRLEAMRESKNFGSAVLNRWRPDQAQSWSEVKTFPGTASVSDAGASPRLLTSAKLATGPGEQLLMLDSASNQVQVVMNDQPAQSAAQAAQGAATEPNLVSIPLAVEGAPVAALSMRLSVMALPGLVVLSANQAAPIILPNAPLVSFVVTKATDTNDGACNADCSLREAIVAANGNGTGADIITFNAGINPTLTIPTGAGLAENAAATGDLDVNSSLTITGNAPTTISTTFTTTCGDCKVFGMDQTGGFPGIQVSFSGVTIQGGNNNATCGAFFETGGGMDFFLQNTGNIFSMTNSTVQNNAATGCANSHGGGVNVDSANTATAGGPPAGTVTFTNVTFASNTALQEGGGLTLAADKHDATLTGCTVGGVAPANGNTAGAVGGGIWIRHSFGGTVTIDGGSISRNTGLNGGGITVDGSEVTNVGLTTGVTIINNTASAATGGLGGGVLIANLGAAGVTGSTQISNSTISTNHADVGANAAGGGIYTTLKYPATISNCAITGNTSLRGAGIFHAGSGSTPADTLTINANTSISNNVAAGAGGGLHTDSPTSITSLNGTTIDSNTSGSGGDGIDQTDGTTSCVGTINLNGGDSINLIAGTFNSTVGTLNLTGSFTRAVAATFNHNSGTFNFNGAGAQNINGTATSETFNNFTVNKGGGTLSVAGSTTSLSIVGNVTLTAGTFAAGTATAIGLTTGNWTNNGGVFTPNSSVVSFTNVAGAQAINGTNASQTFNSITVAKTAQTLSVGGSTTTLNLNGTMLLTSGIFSAGTATNINVGTDWTNNGGTFAPGTGTVTFNGGGAQNLNGTAATQTFNNFTVSKGGGTLTGGGSTTTLNVGGNFAITAGTFAAGTITTLNDAGNWANTGTFTPGAGTVVFNGANSTQTLTGTTTFNNLTSNHTGTGGVTASGSTLTVTGLMRVQAGTFTSSSTFNNVQIDTGATLASDGSTMNVSGNWTNNGGTFTPGTGTVNFNGGAAQAIGGTSASQTFNNFTVNKGGGTLSVGGSTTSLTINGNVTLTAGAFDKGTANTITIVGNWANNGGSFVPGAGTVDFGAGAAQTISGTTATTFNNLTISSPSGLSMTNDNTVNGVLALTNSDITVASGKTLTQPSAIASTGAFDVVGSVKRTGGPLLSGTAYTFGNPNNVITFTAAGTRPTDLTINLVKAAPSGAIGFPNAVNRTYTITPNGGVGFSATVRLHYLDSELNGNTEGAGLNLWRFNGTGWAPIGQSANSTVNNWVEKSGVTSFSPWTFNSTLSPTASSGSVSGRITDSNGTPVAGAVINLSGTQSRKIITDAYGRYEFANVDTNGFYSVTPARANYSFSPTNRSFSQIGNQTEAAFTGISSGDTVNPLDTPEYFVRQQYVDVLRREPDEPGFNFWSDQILACAGDVQCVNTHRREVAAAFFIAEEFQAAGSYIYDVYAGTLSRTPAFAEYSVDRQQVVGGATLDALKTAFARSFVQRAEFAARYQANASADSFVDALIENVQRSGVNLSGERDSLISTYNTGGNTVDSRAAVVQMIADNATFKQSQYNQAFVLTEYFAYLQRDAEPDGYNFWVNVLNTGDPGNYRGMVCSFITSREYQERFSSVVSHTNGECSGR